MRRQPRQSRAIETKRACVTAAELLLPSRGPLCLTPTEVARRAGVSPGSFYQYFPSKQALLAELAEQWMKRHHEDLVECLPLLKASPRAFVEAMQERFAARPHIHHVLMGSIASIEDNAGMQQVRMRTMGALAEALGEERQRLAPVLLFQLDSTLTGISLGLIPEPAAPAAIEVLVRSVAVAVGQ
jgi:AcrR family transcriptional regulator